MEIIAEMVIIGMDGDFTEIKGALTPPISKHTATVNAPDVYSGSFSTQITVTQEVAKWIKKPLRKSRLEKQLERNRVEISGREARRIKRTINRRKA